MKIHNYGNDYAYQQKLKESEKTRTDVDNSVDGPKAEVREAEMGVEINSASQETGTVIGAGAEEKEVSKKKKKTFDH